MAEMARDTPTPETGLDYLFPVSILPYYGRLCLHQPLSGVDRLLTRRWVTCTVTTHGAGLSNLVEVALG